MSAESPVPPPHTQPACDPLAHAAPAETVDAWGVSRRGFMQSASGVAVMMTAGCATSGPGGDGAPETGARPVSFMVNGEPRTVTVAPRVTLLDAIRNELGLTGTKKGCDRGQCGACTVMVQGRRVNSCLTLAVMNEGAHITTVEGLGTPEALHPMQAAFLQEDGFQCGFCTPGQICSAVALLSEWRAGQPSFATVDVRKPPPALDDSEIRERMSGNLCRCGAYSNIVAAVRRAAGQAATAEPHA